ncbi:rhodanese-like domain-containing protein [Lutibacter flavus]|uniref:Rhodanese-related sulfurtransferase n=1 Tax=Lutibacter flavus TaxID=691689 RepID=A0A238YJ70_9FLAO|nr:rhodanese-like domain-containing protein [Lutibacter flavus]SNR71306.1 Rhodanese-related sulfurtransferase [Lutibacter flavus]
MKTTLKLSLLIFISVLSLNCNNSQSTKSKAQQGAIIKLSPKEFKEKSQSQTIIDIRTPQEFAQGHIEGAVNINYFDRSFLEQVSKFDKNKPIFIYCRSGSRTSSASKKMINQGFSEVADLQGGIMNWAKNKNKIVK